MASLINTKAPDFRAPAVMPDGTTKEVSLGDYAGKYVALFFYPKDFTFVCPSELIAFDNRMAEFEKRGVQVLGVSMDDADTHARWRKTAVNDGGIGELNYPLIADTSKSMTNDYNVLHAASGLSLRATFLMDQSGTIQHVVTNNLPLGRDLDELLRMIDALQFHEKHGEVCPAGWTPGKKAMAATPEGVAAYLTENAKGL
tara:strand:+ start:5226 stop:5825 length:600 start_codon:yes stop_codon:yes gene_type:complete